ncbi:MAG TPA: aminotransferase class III-fold pyridoxal phosphate-dependent enzyme, partial [Ktedonobacteraceae bacterium]
SQIWDVDGNEYIDIAMGFGVHLFGHVPHFVTEAIAKQLQEGIPIGTQIPLVGEVAQLACELTGMERVMFANSGTEAVMVALRIARTASKRNKIVMFAGSYHGTYEGVLARMIEEQGEWRTKPVAPGIPPSMVEDMLVLPYDDPRSLDIIEQRADELAAVLVEPVQSRRPELQPKAFLHALREVTRRHKIILIFDEVITGFRIHQGGAQAWFGVQADLATYSKVIGGGLPFSMVAGKRSVMDALDGGMWQYGDTSYPAQEKTQFGGAFFKHPLSLATAWAVFTHLKAEGPALQQRLNDLTNYLASSLNSFFEEQQAPIRMVSFGSLFGFAFQGDQSLSDLFFYHLNAKGIYTWRGRTCFLSTAHSQADVNEIIRVVKESVRDMQRGGFLPSPSAPDTPTPPGEGQQNQQTFMEEAGSGITCLPLSDIQLQAWIATQIESDASRAYNESQTLHLRGPLNLTAMRQALQNLVKRHDALRTTFSPLGDYQYIAASRTLDVPLHDFTNLTAQERTQQVEAWITHKANQPFDLEHGPLFCADVLKLNEQEHLLILTVHHLVVDAQSSEVILKELSSLYTAACQEQADPLPPAMQYSQYTQWLATQKESDQMVRAEAYWLAQYADSLPEVELPSNWPRPHTKTYHGTREGLAFDLELINKLKRLSRQRGSTLFITLLASFQVLLHQLSGQDDLVVGVPANGQVLVNAKDLIGYCINVLPIRSRLAGDPTFAHYLTEVRQQVLDGYDHQIYPLGNLLQKLHPKRNTDRLPLVMVTFNIEHTESLSGFQDLHVESLLNPTNFSKYDMGITIRESKGSLSLSCNYNTDLFSASTIQQWTHLYEALLHLVVAHPEHKISELQQYIKEEAHSYRRKAEASNSNPGIQGSSVE